MKFDRKARAVLLYICLPLYVAMLGAFVYVSNVYKGKYPLPERLMARDFEDFASKGYVLAQEASVAGRRVPPGTVIDETLAGELVKAYGVLGRKVAVVEEVAALSVKHADASKASSLAGENMFVVYPVSIGAPPAAVNVDAGAPLSAETAAKIEEAAAASPEPVEITAAAAEAIAVPDSTEADDFTEFLAAGYVLDEEARVVSGADIVVKEKGTEVSRDVLLGLMAMRDAQQRPEWVRVRGDGPVIGFQHTFVFVLLNFVILVLFLYGLLWKPILGVLDQRKKNIGGDIERARDRRRRAEELFEKYRKIMEEARDDRQGIIEDGRREGEEERQKIIDEAKAETEAMLERARLSMQSDRQQMERELTAQVGAFSVELARRILEREITEEDHRAIVDDFAARMAAAEGEGE